MKILFVGNVLDVVFMDNSRMTATNATDELYSKIMQLHDNEEEAKKLLLPHFQEKVEEYEEAISFQKRATQYPELKHYGDVYIFHQISDISVPKSIVDAFIKAKEEKNDTYVEALLNFWKLTSTVEDSRVRNNIFWYCEKYGIKITQSGLLKLYRNVVVHQQGTTVKTTKVVKTTEVPTLEVAEDVKSGVASVVQSVVESKEAEPVKEEEADLTMFISAEFIRVRTKAKKNPANFTVIKNADGELMVTANEKIVEKALVSFGNLKELYNNLSTAIDKNPEKAEVAEVEPELPAKVEVAEPVEVEEEIETFSPSIYTDSYTGKMRIQIGQMVMLDRTKCDHNQDKTCSAGLHGASKQWLEQQGATYLGSGKASLLILVNPKDIVAIPPVDGYGKLRMCAYLPVKALVWEGRKIADDTYDDVLEGEFFENIVYGKPVESDSEADRYTFAVPEVPDLDFKKVKANLTDLKNKIKSKKLLK